MAKSTQNHAWLGRSQIVLIGFAVVAALLVLRAFYLQVYDREFYTEQGRLRHTNLMKVPGHRGSIVERNGKPLAISAPTETVGGVPKTMLANKHLFPQLAYALGTTPQALLDNVTRRSNKKFIYLKRQLSPQQADRVARVKMPGVEFRREYGRFYPMHGVAAHVVGMTNRDGKGSEGIELSYNDWLYGESGVRKVVRDRLGRVIRVLGQHSQLGIDQDGRELALSIDRRVQYVAYRELKEAVEKHNAKSGSAVVLDVKTGEILAMVNLPTFNPHVRSELKWEHMRNRAVTDTYEPGSTVKPFVIATALERGIVKPTDVIDTSPGEARLGGNVIKDPKNYGLMTPEKILTKSSNVGVVRVGLKIPAEDMWDSLQRFGFGSGTRSGLSGEAEGQLSHFAGNDGLDGKPKSAPWGRTDRAILSYGYGLTSTTLQLARSYAILAAEGVARPVSILKVDSPPKGQQVLSRTVARSVLQMLETVTKPGGTGTRAAIPNYRVAGKTGTAKKVGKSGYENRYIAVFAGIVPASAPRLVTVVMIDEPRRNVFYGGAVAAPVFKNVMLETLRMLEIPPDNSVAAVVSEGAG